MGTGLSSTSGTSGLAFGKMRAVSPSAEPSGTLPAERKDNPFPQVFGKYVLLRPMARGGMGELFLAAAGETGGFEKLCVVKKVLTDQQENLRKAAKVLLEKETITGEELKTIVTKLTSR